MKMPDPIWLMTYSASRRKHNHRCQACWRIIADGEPVLMARVGSKQTRCLHESCADRIAIEAYTWRELLTAHGMTYLAKCGWREAQEWIEKAPICKPCAVA